MPDANNPQSRKWQLTINHPADCGMDHGKIVEQLQLFHPAYFCMADEIATTGTYHMHVYVFAHSPMRFSTLKRRFPTAHIKQHSGKRVALDVVDGIFLIIMWLVSHRGFLQSAPAHQG